MGPVGPYNIRTDVVFCQKLPDDQQGDEPRAQYRNFAFIDFKRPGTLKREEFDIQPEGRPISELISEAWSKPANQYSFFKGGSKFIMKQGTAYALIHKVSSGVFFDWTGLTLLNYRDLKVPAMFKDSARPYHKVEPNWRPMSIKKVNESCAEVPVVCHMAMVTEMSKNMLALLGFLLDAQEKCLPRRSARRTQNPQKGLPRMPKDEPRSQGPTSDQSAGRGSAEASSSKDKSKEGMGGGSAEASGSKDKSKESMGGGSKGASGSKKKAKQGSKK